MKPILFEKDEVLFSTFGLGLLTDAISCTVIEERNGIFELELVYPIGGRNYDFITEDRIIVAKAKENGNKQAFRIYRITQTLSGQITVNARHISYQLNFVPVPDLSGSGTAQTMMNDLAAAALESCPFTFYSDIATSNSYSVPPTSLRSALGGIEGSALDIFGGEFEWDNWEVKLLSSRGSDKGVKIEYAKNMTAFERATDIGELITGVMAFWAGEDESGNSVTVYSNPKVITNGHEADFAYGRTIALDVTSEFETQPTRQQVADYAASYLAATAFSKVNEAITVDFVPLWQTKEYENIYKAHVDLCDTVTIVYKQLGVNVKRKVTRTVFNVLLDRYESIELGGETDIADTINELYSGESDLGKELAKIIAEFRTSNNFRTFSAVNQLGLTTGSATIAQAWAALPNNSILVAQKSDFLSTTVPSQSGTVFIVRSESAARGWIEFFTKGADAPDYRMGLNSSNNPTETWEAEWRWTSFTVSVTVTNLAAGASQYVNISSSIPANYFAVACAITGSVGGSASWLTTTLNNSYIFVRNNHASSAQTSTMTVRVFCARIV